MTFAQKASPGDKVYDIRSEPQGSCPATNWHIVATPAGVLSGMVAFDNMKTFAAVAGTMMQLTSKQERTFRMMATEIGGNRQATIVGTVFPNFSLLRGT